MEWRTARQHLVKDGTQGVHVRGRPRHSCLAGCLLGGHVAGRTDPRTGNAQADFRVETPGETEIGDLWRAAGRQKDVRWLEVAMHDPAAVGGLHGAGQRDHEYRGISSWLRNPGQLLSEVATIEEFHREVR
jgi:hypothetical protein